MTPLARYQQDLAHIRTLGAKATQLDAIFQYRITRTVRKDGTVSYEGRRWEVPYELTGKNVRLIVDPHTLTAVAVEDEHGTALGSVTPLNQQANRHRKRHKPTQNPAPAATAKSLRPTLLDLAYAQHYGPIAHASVPDESTAQDA